MNFNQSNREYQLQGNLTNELINLYGVQVKLALVEKINKDDLVFGDYSHIKTNTDSVHEIYGLPENSETWDNIGINFNQFGLTTIESINLYFSRATIESVIPNVDSTKGFDDIIGNLVILPSGRIMEITAVEYEVPGANNMFTYNNTKNVYKFSLKTYDIKLSSEIDEEILEPGDYTKLTDYFDELSSNIDDVDNEAEEVTVEKPKAIVPPIVDDVFDRM